MIEVQNLSKRYGQHVALDGVSFSVGCGEVVGFLGPNGAGKSTTMRILTTFMAATSGSVRVGGDCVFENPMRVRERIGYMPENNPLPTDLRVGDYLKFRAQLKRLANGDSANRIAEVMEQCGVADVAGRFIGQLSRGYRQRVGLADALLAKPELIVLDEPTAGLDPNQVRSVRRLIRELAGGHTVLISSHILSEIEMTCDRVVILHEGRLLASGALEELMAKANAAVVAEVRASLTDAKSGPPNSRLAKRSARRSKTATSAASLPTPRAPMRAKRFSPAPTSAAGRCASCHGKPRHLRICSST